MALGCRNCRLYSLCIAQGARGGGGGTEDFFWGEIFLREKGVMVKISEGRKGNANFF